MKKYFLIFLLYFSFASANYARTYLVATLQHEGQFAQFYGADALTSAYNAAVDGDIITLSPGEFTFSGTINKGITLRGVGVGASDQTIINAVTFSSQDSTSVTIVEGIKFKSNVSVVNSPSDMGQGTIKFIKNHFASLYAGRSGNPSATDKAPSVKLYNNIINFMEFGGNTYPDFQFYNCYVGDPHVQLYASISETSTTFRNCLIEWKSKYCPNPSGTTIYYSSYPSLAEFLNFNNCIFNYTVKSDYNRALPSTASCINCLSIGKSDLFASVFYNQNNKYDNNIANVFLTYTSGYVFPETFEMTVSAKETYLDSDGVEIGIQGGLYPFNLRVQYPVITSFSADTQTTKEGKLNVTIEVDGK